MDLIRGAALAAEGGRIIALPSVAGNGISRISPALQEGAGVVATRAHVRTVVTEWGVAELFGKSLRERARALIAIAHLDHRDLLIADEVMTGFGRTGTWFGLDHWGVRPDILVAAKGASSGYWPLGFTAASGAVSEAVAAGGFMHGFTYSQEAGGPGGGPRGAMDPGGGGAPGGVRDEGGAAAGDGGGSPRVAPRGGRGSRPGPAARRGAGP